MFKEIPASKNSISNRKPVYGVGINDVDYLISKTVNRKMVLCPYYSTWTDMIARCYSEKYHDRRPTYIKCIVASEWQVFSNFKNWMVKQNWEGNHLDKDILFPGNKIYSAESCVFVSKELNGLLLDCGASRGKYPRGVTLDKRRNVFRSQCRLDGKNIFLGEFNDPQEAAKVYNKFKSELVIKTANEQSDQRIKNGLLIHAKLILKG